MLVCSFPTWPDTPLKTIRCKPENQLFEKIEIRNHVPSTSIFGFRIIFWGVIYLNRTHYNTFTCAAAVDCHANLLARGAQEIRGATNRNHAIFARMDTTDHFVICFFFSFRFACLFFFQDLILSSFRFVSLVRCKFHKKNSCQYDPGTPKFPKTGQFVWRVDIRYRERLILKICAAFHIPEVRNRPLRDQFFLRNCHAW